MHKVDEHVPVAHFGKLTDIYEAILRGYFKKAPTS
jgi:acetylornithine deacetylase/succinyl-diaminopimelate desuccinylase-like protein